MKCLVTGGAGFIGSHLVAHMESNGHEVVVLDNLSSGNRDNLKGRKATLVEGDLRNMQDVEKAVAGVDVVLHHAALCSVPGSVEDPASSYDVNVTGTLLLLEACQRAGVKRVVFASSSAVYGESEVCPKLEDMETSPISPYAMSKLIGEHSLRSYADAYDLEVVMLRYFNVFGPRQNPDSEYAAVIPKFIQAIANDKRPIVYGDGEQTRDFTHVKNIAEANLLAATTEGLSGEIMNIACGDRISLLDLLENIEKAMGRDVDPEFQDVRAGDVKHSQASIEKAARLMNYDPQVGLEEGLKETVDWYLEANGLNKNQERRSA